jgi:hypothetical protein
LQLGLDSHPGDLLVGQTGHGAFADPAQHREGTGVLDAFAGELTPLVMIPAIPRPSFEDYFAAPIS